MRTTHNREIYFAFRVICDSHQKVTWKYIYIFWDKDLPSQSGLLQPPEGRASDKQLHTDTKTDQTFGHLMTQT